MTKTEDVEKIVTKFKIDLLKTMPFYGDVVTKLAFISDPHIKTACTNGMNVRYNPKFLAEKESIGEIYFILMHEVFHVMLLHCKRENGRNKKIWNVSCDFVVNKMLSDLTQSIRMNGNYFPLSMPSGALYSELKQGETVESIYAEQMAVNNKLKLYASQTVRVSIKLGWNKSEIKDVNAPDDLQPHSKKKNSKNKNSSDVRSDASLPSFDCDSIEEKSDFEADGEEPAIEIDEATEEHIKGIIGEAMQKTRGMGAGYYIPEVFYSTVQSKDLNWKKMLKQFLSWQISDDSSYATPERKYLHMDLILPGHCMDEGDIEEIWAFVDSSGSISSDEMNQFLTQLYRIVKEFKCVLHICYWDTSVTDIYKNIRNENDVLKSIPKHSGGTDINCVYKWLRENKVKPDVMLILTDGYFGALSSEYQNRALQKKTIVVLSTSNTNEKENIKAVGRIAAL